MKLFDLTALANRSGRWPIALLSLVVAVVLAVAGCTALSAAIGELPTRAPGKAVSMETAGSSQRAAGTPEYMPAVFGSALDPTVEPTPTATPTATATTPSQLGPPLPAPTVVVAAQPVDFEAARATAQAQGKDIAFVKIGFHTGPGGNSTGLGDYLTKLNDAGVPFFVKSVDGTSGLLEGQAIMKANESAGRYVDHTLVFRLTDKRFEDPYYNLTLSPEEAAAISWQLNRDNMPPNLEKEYVWLETLNEPGRLGNDGNYQIDRLGRFSLATAKLAVAEGYRYAALAFSRGVPEVGDWPAATTLIHPNDWEDPDMLEFLRYAGEHPDQVAVALHEYSGTIDYIGYSYPYLLGRLQALFDTVDRHGIPRPTVLITEWGWAHNDVPEPDGAVNEDIAWAAWLYAAYPTVRGAAIWYLGPQFEGIANKAQRLIAPLGDYAVSHYYIIDPGIGRIDPSLFEPNPPTILNEDMEYLLTPYPLLQEPNHLTP